MQRNIFTIFIYSTLTVTVYAEIIAGYVNIVTNGGNGKPGQNGANGRTAANSKHKVHYSIIDMHDIGKLREKSLFIAWRGLGGGEGRGGCMISGTKRGDKGGYRKSTAN